MEIIRVENLTQAFRSPDNHGAAKANPLFQKLSFQVEKGDVFLIEGPTGSGKTILLHLLANHVTALCGGRQPFSHIPNQKTVFTGNIWIRGLSDRLPTRRTYDHFFAHIPTYPQFIYQQSSLSHTSEPLRNLGFPPEVVEKKCREFLKTFHLNPVAGLPVFSLSSGQRQCLAIIRALLSEPTLLLADEPLVILDPVLQKAALEFIVEQSRIAGTTVIFATSQPSQFEQVGHLVNGKITLYPTQMLRRTP